MPNRRQPSSLTQTPNFNFSNVRHSMQPDEDLNRSKKVFAIGLSRVICCYWVESCCMLLLGWVVLYRCYEYWSEFILISTYIIHILFILCTNILLFHFRLNLYWWILGRNVQHKVWFCFNHSFLFIFRWSSSGLF